MIPGKNSWMIFNMFPHSPVLDCMIALLQQLVDLKSVAEPRFSLHICRL